LTVVAIVVKNMNLGIFALSLVFFTALSYFSKPEQAYYVWVHAETPKIFSKKQVTPCPNERNFLDRPDTNGSFGCFLGGF
jgi:hypothetical protein